MTPAASPSPARFHPRVEAGFPVRLVRGAQRVVARAADLSMAGCRLQGEVGREGERLTLQLLLPGAPVLTTGATVRRRRAGAVAVEFDPLDWDQLIALARFVHPRLPA